MIRLKDGETNMLAGLIRDDEREVLSGMPGLSDIPVIGRLFAYNHMQTQETDIILTLTPRIVRVLDLSAEDLRAVPRRPRRRRHRRPRRADADRAAAARPAPNRPSRRPPGRRPPARRAAADSAGARAGDAAEAATATARLTATVR